MASDHNHHHGGEAGDDGAAAVAEQGKLLPAQLVSDLYDFGNILPDVVAGIGGAKAAFAVTGTVQGNNMQIPQVGQHYIKAGGVIKPAMEGDNRYAPRCTPLFGSDCQAVDIKGSFTGEAKGHS